MKKLFSLIIFFIIISFIFSSCNQSTGISLTKRHYMNGYNLQISGKLSIINIQKAERPKEEVIEDEAIEGHQHGSIQSSHRNYVKREPLSFAEYYGSFLSLPLEGDWGAYFICSL